MSEEKTVRVTFFLKEERRNEVRKFVRDHDLMLNDFLTALLEDLDLEGKEVTNVIDRLNRRTKAKQILSKLSDEDLQRLVEGKLGS